MNENVKIKYLYRDAGNYKSWGATVFVNPDGLSLYEIENRLKKAFFHREVFIASQIGIHGVFMYTIDNPTEDDHCFHEFDTVELTNETSDDLYNRTIKNFVEQVEIESTKGWQAFIP